jgi:hypothetical protein
MRPYMSWLEFDAQMKELLNISMTSKNGIERFVAVYEVYYFINECFFQHVDVKTLHWTNHQDDPENVDMSYVPTQNGIVNYIDTVYKKSRECLERIRSKPWDATPLLRKTVNRTEAMIVEVMGRISSMFLETEIMSNAKVMHYKHCIMDLK